MVPSLKRPIWPLARTILFLCLAAPEKGARELIEELPSGLEAGPVQYRSPADAMLAHVDVVDRFKAWTAGAGPYPPFPVTLPEGREMDPLEAALRWAKQEILSRELEVINSLLCGPRGCVLCCTGPDEDARHLFFEIPLYQKELPLFQGLEHHDSSKSRSKTPYDEEELLISSDPFYKRAPLLIRWRTGWSLVLGKGQACPNLVEGRCVVYSGRPEVCRKPQIFPYIAEKRGDKDEAATASNTILAVLDCPYVQELKSDIEEYARMCEADLVFKTNKA